MKQEYYFGTAKAVTEGSNYADSTLMLSAKHDTVISTGTNGAPRGEIDCSTPIYNVSLVALTVRIIPTVNQYMRK